MSSSLFFFQQPDFIFRNGQSNIISFNGEGGVSICFTKIDRHLVSSARSPFGSFIIPEDVIDKSSLKALIEVVLLEAESLAIESIEIKCFPEVYAPQKAKAVCDVLFAVGFRLKYKEITQLLLIDQALNLNADRRRKIKQCTEHQFSFRELATASLPEAYNLFLQSRRNKGYPLTMTLQDFFDEFTKFPLRYKLYGVWDGDQLIAASVVVIINDEILYYFFSGDNLAYRNSSPTSYLVYHLYQLARRMNYKFIDLGISTDRGILNNGLYYFKKSFGAIDSFKLIFEKSL
ncbi:MAG: GNAT family N-acetyltransferase [Cyclobacteriaceae bacterium]|nr:GNAT family N-acetyltransferase [Cyclobacteriaceae bacterium]